MNHWISPRPACPTARIVVFTRRRTAVRRYGEGRNHLDLLLRATKLQRRPKSICCGEHRALQFGNGIITRRSFVTKRCSPRFGTTSYSTRFGGPWIVTIPNGTEKTHLSPGSSPTQKRRTVPSSGTPP